MTISHNMLAINANRQLGIVERCNATAMEKLSSGYKINRASDDAAGLAISEKMRRLVRGLSRGVENTQDGVSLCQVADGALSEVNDMLHRITELSIQAANGTLSDNDRKAVQWETSQILEEIERICDTTTFNEIKLFGKADSFTGSSSASVSSANPVSSHTEVIAPGLALTMEGKATDATIARYEIISNGTNGFKINNTDISFSDIKTTDNSSLADGIKTGQYEFEHNGLKFSFDIQDAMTLEDISKAIDGMVIERSMISASQLNYRNYYAPHREELYQGSPYKVYANENGIGMTGKYENFVNWESADYEINYQQVSFDDILKINSTTPTSVVLKLPILDANLELYFQYHSNNSAGTADSLKDALIKSFNNQEVNIQYRRLDYFNIRNTYPVLTGISQFSMSGMTFVDEDAFAADFGFDDKTKIQQADLEERFVNNGGQLELHVTCNGRTKKMVLSDDEVKKIKEVCAGGTSTQYDLNADFGSFKHTIRFRNPIFTYDELLSSCKINYSVKSVYLDNHYWTFPDSETGITWDVYGVNFIVPNGGGNTQKQSDSQTSNSGKGIWIQSGCEAGDGLYIKIDNMSTKTLGINRLDVSTVDGALEAIDKAHTALHKVLANRSKIGAQQNRLTHIIANEENTIENITASESRIRDVDMAEELVRHSIKSILVQAGQSMLAQANESAQGVMALLQ